MRSVSWISLLLLLVACEQGAVTTQNTTPRNPPPADAAVQLPSPKPVKPTIEDPDAWRKVRAPVPEGWFSVRKTDCDDLFRQLRRPPSELQFVSAIASKKPPGSTAREPEWMEWSATTGAAILYFVGKDKVDPQDVVAKFAPLTIKDASSTQSRRDGLAWARAAEGRALIIAANNQFGTYLIIGLVPAGGSEEAIVGWASNIQA